ncbi:hypothetical protein CBR_g22258 [Chara braunii]|uniref:PITH domain-containing protein n=1 Tax=Chara braunii TaxID=69332 RepID=A0A388L2G9_CHABU|nr:hypothetical protein CBR_g22258 [Chara braunii]|eukprot:GBG76510.1 hypothetical protein CBR_g22258 [Chara braunii]
MSPGHGATCSHDHDCGAHSCGADWSLYKTVDIPRVRALNEAVDGSAKTVIKTWERRLDFSTYVESEDDPELIIFIPFTADVKIKSISIIGGVDGTSPSKMRVFLNREDIDFANANDVNPVQEWELAENLRGELEYQTRYPKFQGIANITLHFSGNFGGDVTRIHYIGFRGESTQMTRKPVTNVVYELMPQLKDHKTKAEHGGAWNPVV